MAANRNFSESNDELWRECALWLTRWEMLGYNHKVNLPGSSITDLASILRDGVLLCKLLNKIDPGCINMKDVCLKPTMAQFLCLRNTNIFLEICKLKFGLKGMDLFEATMLYDLHDFHKVLCTLSKLSLSSKALMKGIEGFSAQNEVTADEDDIYHDLINFRPTEEYSSFIDIYGTYTQNIYQDLVNLRRELKPAQAQSKQDYVIKELLDTEKNYVDVLSKLKMSFMLPLQIRMKFHDHACIFHRIKDLYDIHSTMLVEMTKIKTNPRVRLSDIFLKYTDKFLVYGSYCANLNKATNLLQELCDQNYTFNKTIMKLEKDIGDGRFKLKDFLTVPLQRVLKYHLLLAELIKSTDKDNDEHADLSKAREAMLDVNDYINEESRDAEHLDVINNLQETIVEWELAPGMRLSDYGRLIKDAELKMKKSVRGEDQKFQTVYIFIFERCVLICKKSVENLFAYQDMLNLKEYRILDQDANNFSLVKDGSRVYTFCVRTQELKRRITETIKEAVDTIRPKVSTNHDFKLHTFSNPVQCEDCFKYLKGLISQGYICKNCNMYVHKGCLQSVRMCGSPSSRPSSLNNDIRIRNLDPLWYVGEMDRKIAKTKLLARRKGTFLVRQSLGKDHYVLDLRSDKMVRHMRIHTTDNGNDSQYYLSDAKYYDSIDELVSNYKKYSLKENFPSVNEKLLYPFNQ